MMTIAAAAAEYEYNICKIFVVTGLAHPVFFETIEPRVTALVNLISDPAVDYRTVSYEERASMGYDSDESWALEVLHTGDHFSAPLYYMCCMDRAVLEKLALEISRMLPSYSLRLCRWARFRWIMVNQKITRDFPLVPYSDKPEAEWV